MQRTPEEPVSTVLLAEVLWQRLDGVGFEYCRFVRVRRQIAIRGVVLTPEKGAPCKVQYTVICDSDWLTRAVNVHVARGSETRVLEVTRDEGGVWLRGGEPMPGFEGVMDVDLAVTPSTNTLPIRRLALDVGEEARTDAVWIGFPDLAIGRLSQRYSRVRENVYSYESNGASFTAEIDVDDVGVTVRYGEIWERVA